MKKNEQSEVLIIDSKYAKFTTSCFMWIFIGMCFLLVLLVGSSMETRANIKTCTRIYEGLTETIRQLDRSDATLVEKAVAVEHEIFIKELPERVAILEKLLETKRR